MLKHLNFVCLLCFVDKCYKLHIHCALWRITSSDQYAQCDHHSVSRHLHVKCASLQPPSDTDLQKLCYTVGWLRSYLCSINVPDSVRNSYPLKRQQEKVIGINPFQSNFSANRILPSSYLFWEVKRLVDYLKLSYSFKRENMEKHKEYKLRYLLAKVRTTWGKASERLRQQANKCNKSHVSRLPTSEQNCKIILSDKVRCRIEKD
jgi:hypothetical protein